VTAKPKLGPNRGNAGKGRPKGSQNKATANAKAAIEMVFTGLGGPDALKAWANKDDENLKAFYVSIWPKILPLQVNGPGDQGEHLHKIVREFHTPHPDR
jgi:hypothetical protein